MKKILHFLRIHAPTADVFDALATPEGLSGWWSTQVTGEAEALHFRFFGDFNPDMKIVESRENERIEWECVSGHDNWLSNTFVFELRDVEDETDLMFTQTYAEELADETYGNYNFNWGYYLFSLKRFVEIGIGTPFDPESH